MKRTFPTNIDGRVFYIDDDAYKVLNQYLSELRNAFKGEEGEEIVVDIESRIRDHFSDQATGATPIITITDVERVIAIIGRASDLSGNDTAEDPSSKTTETAPDAGEPKSTTPPPPPIPVRKKLYRSMRNKVLGGVFGGLAAYLGWNANVMRILFIILLFALLSHHFGLLILAYLIAWMIIPEARTPRQILEMNGEAINVGNLGRTVINESGVVPPPVNQSSDSNFLATFFSFIGKGIVGLIGLGAGAIFIASIIYFLASLVGVSSLYIFHNDIYGFVGMEGLVGMGMSVMLITMIGSLASSIIFGFTTWACLSSLLVLPPMRRSLVVTLLIILLVLIAAITAMSFVLL